jgi:hypothetical protein
MMLVDRGEVRRCGLGKAWNGRDGYVCQVVWLLESAMDRILGVDTLGQQVLPHVRYGMTC